MVFDERTNLVAVDRFLLKVKPSRRTASLSAAGTRPLGGELARAGLNVDFVLNAVAFVDFSSHRLTRVSKWLFGGTSIVYQEVRRSILCSLPRLTGKCGDPQNPIGRGTPKAAAIVAKSSLAKVVTVEFRW